MTKKNKYLLKHYIYELLEIRKVSFFTIILGICKKYTMKTESNLYFLMRLVRKWNYQTIKPITSAINPYEWFAVFKEKQFQDNHHV